MKPARHAASIFEAAWPSRGSAYSARSLSLDPPERPWRERKSETQATYDRVLIVSEGSKTEPSYFNEIRVARRLNTAKVQIYPSEIGTESIQVVQYARDLFERGNTHKKIRPRAFEQIYAVFDRDDHNTYFDALKLAADLNGTLKSDLKQPVKFCAIPSVPCFEFWLLLHYRDVVFKRLKTHIPNYEKGASNMFRTTAHALPIAKQRAENLAERGHRLDGEFPYTDVGILVELLLNLGNHDR